MSIDVMKVMEQDIELLKNANAQLRKELQRAHQEKDRVELELREARLKIRQMMEAAEAWRDGLSSPIPQSPAP